MLADNLNFQDSFKYLRDKYLMLIKKDKILMVQESF